MYKRIIMTGTAAAILGACALTPPSQPAYQPPLPEFDSMAVVSVITALEDQLGIFVEDDDITGETFETLGNLTAFIQTKL